MTDLKPMPSASVSLEMIYQYIAKRQHIAPDSDLAIWFKSVKTVLETRIDRSE